MVQLAGILNVTPDSFSDGGSFVAVQAAVEHGLAMSEEGAAWIDVGGESTRPGSLGVTASEECKRVLPVVEALVGHGVAVSIDTSKPEVAAAALSAGAQVVNDVNGLRAPGMLETVASHNAGAVIMHMRGDPKNMQDNLSYRDVVEEVCAFLASRYASATEAGIDTIWLDPGIGFGKSVDQNCALIGAVRQIRALGAPVYIGASRKSFLGVLTGQESPMARLPGSLAAALAAYDAGVDVIRVHDVRATLDTIRVWEAVRNSHPKQQVKA